MNFSTLNLSTLKVFDDDFSNVEFFNVDFFAPAKHFSGPEKRDASIFIKQRYSERYDFFDRVSFVTLEVARVGQTSR